MSRMLVVFNTKSPLNKLTKRQLLWILCFFMVSELVGKLVNDKSWFQLFNIKTDNAYRLNKIGGMDRLSLTIAAVWC